MGCRSFGLLFAVALSASLSVRAAPPVEAYGKLPAVEEVHLSPSGGRYAMIANDGEKRRLYVLTTDNKPLSLIDIGNAKVREVEWAGEDHVLVTVTATVGMGPEFTVTKDELETVVAYNITTGTSFQVFGRGHNGKIANSVFGRYGTRLVNGRWYGWFGGITFAQSTGASYLNHGYADLYRVDLESGEVQLAARGREDSDGWLISPTGEVAARSLYNEKSGSWKIMAGRDGDQVLAAGHNDFGGVGTMTPGRTAETLLVDAPTGETGEKAGAYEHRELTLADGQAQALPGYGSMDEPIFDPVTHLWIGEILLNDQRESVFFSPALQARWAGARRAFPKNFVHLSSWTPDFNRMVVFTEGGDDSGTYWIVDVTKHSADPIGSAYPAVKGDDVGAVGMVDWKAADGFELYGILTLPPGRQPKALPLVVLPHGGPQARDYPSFDWWAQAFASRGYAVFQPNFRGSSGYGVKYRNAGLGEWGRKMQTDISDGVSALANKGIVDPKRACIVGGSYGGYAALAGVTVQQGLYRCAVSVAGVADLSDMLAYDHKRSGGPSAMMRYWKAFMGVTATGESSQLRPITPADLADRADAPVLLIHGKDDTVVPLEQSETMESALRHAGKPVEMVVMKNEDHWLSREATRVEMLNAAVAFVVKNDPPN
jgi:dipeptidyl aminopeptidase/acylaminoacyl peptidase